MSMVAFFLFSMFLAAGVTAIPHAVVDKSTFMGWWAVTGLSLAAAIYLVYPEVLP